MIWCQVEPTLTSLLDDPLIRAVMHADGVELAELEAALRRVSRRLDAAPDEAERPASIG
jgi:hypothetical protein